MRRNVASQAVAAQMNSRTDGSPLTSAVTVLVTKDGGTQSASGGTLTHKGNGHWNYAPTQAETDASHVAFTFTHATGVNQTVQVWPVSYDPTDGVRLGLTALPNAATGAVGGLMADIVAAGTAQSGGPSLITLSGSDAAPDDFYVGARVGLVGGTGAGQSRIVNDYSASSKQAAVSRPWVTEPDNTTLYVVTHAEQPALNAFLQVVASGVAGDVNGDLAGNVTGDVVGSVGGNVAGSVGSVGAGGISASTFAANAVGSNAVAPSATQEIAEAVLKHDLSTVTGEARRSLLNVGRKLINKWEIAGTTLTVNLEDDATPAYTETLTGSGGVVTGSDPD